MKSHRLHFLFGVMSIPFLSTQSESLFDKPERATPASSPDEGRVVPALALHLDEQLDEQLEQAQLVGTLYGGGVLEVVGAVPEVAEARAKRERKAARRLALHGA